MSLPYARLICVGADRNNNKFYEMAARADGTFEVTYGRVGAAPQRRTYPLVCWQGKYAEKVSKGYHDVTALAVDAPAEAFVDVACPQVQDLLAALQRASLSAVTSRYAAGWGSVTAAQIGKAQALLDHLARLLEAESVEVPKVNALLGELYTAIPRRMTSVRDHLLHENADDPAADLRGLLTAEQDTLGALRSQVALAARPAQAAPRTLLDALGISVALADAHETQDIARRMGDMAPLLRRAFRVTQHAQEEVYSAHLAGSRNKHEALLWHGSRSENWLSILQQGLVLRPATAVITGKMFGYGLYFADACRKSVGYTSLRGARWTGGGAGRAYLALFRVHLGRPFVVKRWKPEHMQLTAERLTGLGTYDALHARGGADLVHDEFVVYRAAQCTMAYLAEIEQPARS